MFAMCFLPIRCSQILHSGPLIFPFFHSVFFAITQKGGASGPFMLVWIFNVWKLFPNTFRGKKWGQFWPTFDCHKSKSSPCWRLKKKKSPSRIIATSLPPPLLVFLHQPIDPAVALRPFSSKLLNELSPFQRSAVHPYLSVLFVCLVSSPTSFLSSSSSLGVSLLHFLMLIIFPFVISPSSTLPPFHFLQGQASPPPPPPLPPPPTPSLLSQWAQPPETPVLFVEAEGGMGNDVAFTSVAGRHTSIARNLQHPHQTHAHTLEAWRRMGCACAESHIILVVDASQVSSEHLTVSPQYVRKFTRINQFLVTKAAALNCLKYSISFPFPFFSIISILGVLHRILLSWILTILSA